MRNLKSILKGKEIQKYLFNTSWMLGEKMMTMGLTMIVSIFVARYLGPENFGVLAYAVSLTSLFAIATHMGLSGLAVRELVNHPQEHNELMSTFIGLKVIGTVISLVFFYAFVFFSDADGIELIILIILSATILLKPFEVFDFWFQSKVKSKYPAIIRTASSTTVSLVKLSLVFISAGLIAFALANILLSILISSFLLILYLYKSKQQIRFKYFNFNKVKQLLGEGWMIMLGAIFAMVYLKIDQIMLRLIINPAEVGVYSVAAKLSESWYFIPNVIVASLFPKLLELKKESEQKYQHRLQSLFDLLFSISFTIAIIVTLIAPYLINLLYGDEYQISALILSIHIWAGIFIFMRAAFSKWILIEDAILFSLLTQGGGALVNIILNLIIIPLYGGVGAAVTTIISYAAASYFSLFFYKRSRPVFWMMSKSLILPFRYTIRILGNK